LPDGLGQLPATEQRWTMRRSKSIAEISVCGLIIQE
jgi:hypothetical protein